MGQNDIIAQLLVWKKAVPIPKIGQQYFGNKDAQDCQDNDDNQESQAIGTNERFAQFVEIRDEIMNSDFDFLKYDWYENLIPIAEETLKKYATLLEFSAVDEFIQFIRYWWFEEKLEGFLNYYDNENTDFYWRRLSTSA